MCGICGFNKTTPLTLRMEPILAMCMAGRGKDSWGATDGDFLAKIPHSILDTWEDFGLYGPTFHTRGASVGGVSEENAHPFKVDCVETGLTVVGVHNGHIFNYEELKKKYSRKGAVDSEQIFAQLAEGKPVEEISGWLACVWYEYPIGKPQERRRFISRHNNTAMHLARLDTKEAEIVFASTKEAIEIACNFTETNIKQWLECKEDIKYELRDDKTGWYTHGKLAWGASPLVEKSTSMSGQHGGGRGWRSQYSGSHICVMPRCTRTVYGCGIICNGCLCKIAWQYYGVEGVKIIDPQMKLDKDQHIPNVGQGGHDRRLICL